jgi:hypothetical protein
VEFLAGIKKSEERDTFEAAEPRKRRRGREHVLAFGPIQGRRRLGNARQFLPIRFNYSGSGSALPNG